MEAAGSSWPMKYLRRCRAMWRAGSKSSSDLTNADGGFRQAGDKSSSTSNNWDEPPGVSFRQDAQRSVKVHLAKNAVMLSESETSLSVSLDEDASNSNPRFFASPRMTRSDGL